MEVMSYLYHIWKISYLEVYCCELTDISGCE